MKNAEPPFSPTSQKNLERKQEKENSLPTWTKLLNNNRVKRTTTPSSKESSKPGVRNDFLRDFDKITFSSIFRRLQDKTQVFPLSKNDNVHTRLTHSMECACVGRSLGREVGMLLKEKNSITQDQVIEMGDIVAAACLAHDIGNPPFGHQGEQALRAWWVQWMKENEDFVKQNFDPVQIQDLGRFEGNATGFRFLAETYNLRLTNAVLATYTKYPCTADKIGKGIGANSKKNGLYWKDVPQFRAVAAECGLQLDSKCLQEETTQSCWMRHPLSYLVEAADNICYQVIDPEDATRLKILPKKEVRDKYQTILDGFSPKKLDRSQHRLEELRGELIDLAIKEVANNFMLAYEEIMTGTFAKTVESGILKNGLNEFISIYDDRSVVEIEVASYTTLKFLMDLFVGAALCATQTREQQEERAPKRRPDIPEKIKLRESYYKHAFKLLPADIQNQIQRADKPYEVILIVSDYVIGMTDSFAVALHQRLSGNSFT